MKFVLASILITLALLGPVMSKSKHAVRQQQTQASYTFYQGMDSGGNDIKNVGGQSVDQLKEICNNEPRCVGFNTNGWVKHTLSPQAQWSRWSSNADQGFYVKNVNQPEYIFHQGMDSGGNDIKNVGGQSVDQLKEICNQEPRCVGFNTNGWVKHTLAPQSQWSRWSSNPNQGFYVKAARPQFEYTFHQGMDSGGNDIKNVGGQSVDQLKEICNQEPRCVAFNTNGWVKHTLSPQSQWSRWSNQANEGMYVKTPIVQYDYTFVQGMDSDGNDIKNVGGQTFDQLREICNREPRCAGFNTNGWIKHTLKPQSQWNRWSSNPTQGFYVRNDRYTFVQGMDSDGNDIKNVGGQTVEQLKDICSKDPRCVGFNTNGWIKHTLKPQSQWNRWSNNPTQGFYVRQTRPNSVSLVQKGSSKKQKVLHA